MSAATAQPPRDRKIYGVVLMLGALIQLLLLAMSVLSTPGYFGQPGGTIVLIVEFVIILLAYIIIGYFALRARRPETIFVLCLATIIGLFCGSMLGVLMAHLASGPHEAALGVVGMVMMPFFIIPLLQYAGITAVLAFGNSLFVLPLHTLAFFGMGIVSFWIVRRTGSVKYGIWSTLLIAMTTTLFILYGGIIYALIFPSSYLSLSNYTNAMTLFMAPLKPLLFYALISGTIGAFLSLPGRFRSAFSLLMQ